MILKRGRIRALVTGANGLIGSSVVRELTRVGFVADFENLDVSLSSPDFTLFRETHQFISKTKPNVVINCAAKRPQSSSTRATAGGNHQIVESLVGALESFDFEVQFIQFGSSAEYSPSDTLLDEKSECQPESKYGIDKVLSTSFLMSLGQNSPIKPVVLRPSTVYGFGQAPDMLVPLLSRAIHSGQKVAIQHPEAVRDFIHVDDVARACSLLMEKQEARGEIFNIASGNPRSVLALVRLMAEITGSKVADFAEIGEGFTDNRKPDCLVLSPRKIFEACGWTAQVGLPEGLRKSHAN